MSKKMGDDLLREYEEILEKMRLTKNDKKIMELEKAVNWIRVKREKLNQPIQDKPILIGKQITNIKHKEFSSSNLEINEKYVDNKLLSNRYNEIDEIIDKQRKRKEIISIKTIIDEVKNV